MTLALIAEFPVHSIKITMPQWINDELNVDDVAELREELFRIHGVVDVMLSTDGWIELDVDLAMLPDCTAEIAHVCNERRRREQPCIGPVQG